MRVKKKNAKAAGARRRREGDPERSTELLWGRRGSGGRAKQGLSLDRVVRAAVEQADAGGMEDVSMRRIAERLGFTTMSLYRHVPGKEELTDLMREAVLGEVARRAGPPGPWRAALESWAREGWSLYGRHPWLALISGTRHVPGPNAVARYESALEAVSSTDLAPAERVAAVGLLGQFVESAARQVVETEQTEQATGVTESEWWGARGSLFEKLDPYPALEAIWRAGGYDHPEDPFEFGLQRVLDGIEALVRSRAAARSKRKPSGPGRRKGSSS
jgi:AcrR family transcriptional regulator